MRKVTNAILIFAVLALTNCAKKDNIDPVLKAEYPLQINVTVANTSSIEDVGSVFSIPVQLLKSKADNFNPAAFVVSSNGVELSSQSVDFDSDGNFDGIVVKSDFHGNEEKKFTILFAESGEKSRSYPKMTQAELSCKFDGKWKDRVYVGGEFRNIDYISVPLQHKDHSLFFRYEGPGWESDKVGYRYYLDQRNAIDIYGKKTTEMVLQNVGLDGYDSYHEPADWGMDILHVGNSLGIGSLGMLSESGKVNRVEVTDSITCRISENGSIYSQIRTKYYGWHVDGNKYDVISDLSIVAGSRLTKHDVQIAGNPTNLCTGIVKHPDATFIDNESSEGDWSYIANYGLQSLAGDSLGMAVLYKTEDKLEIKDDGLSHIVSLKPSGGALTYYFLAAWEEEPEGIKTKADFKAYLDETVAKLNTPIEVK